MDDEKLIISVMLKPAFFRLDFIENIHFLSVLNRAGPYAVDTAKAGIRRYQ